MYSSVMDAIVTDPALMNVPVDDHMVHRGHAVFDTCNVRKGKAYGLDMHLDRIINSASKARIDINDRWSKSDLRDVILQTIAATEKRDDIFVRYWLSAGRGNFDVSPTRCSGSQFYVMVHKDPHLHEEVPSRLPRHAAVLPTSLIPEKPPLLATTKSNNYMINALLALEAEKRGADFCVHVDSDTDTVLESAVSCVAVITNDDVLLAPPTDRILPSTTLRRLVDFVPTLVRDGVISGFEQRSIRIDELRGAKEVIELGGGWIHPVVTVDRVDVGTGAPGKIFHTFSDTLIADLENPECLDDIPYKD